MPGACVRASRLPDLPTGRCSNGCGGVLFHEAVGHPLEADAIDKEASVYRGRVGDRCASELIDGVDDATIPNGWGSYDFDDEGEPAQRTELFREGVPRRPLTLIDSKTSTTGVLIATYRPADK